MAKWAAKTQTAGGAALAERTERPEIEGTIVHLRGCPEEDKPISDLEARTESFTARRPKTQERPAVDVVVARCVVCGASVVEE